MIWTGVILLMLGVGGVYFLVGLARLREQERAVMWEAMRERREAGDERLEIRDKKQEPRDKTMKTGIEIITEERKRQIEVHGYDAFDDDGYIDEELVKAAICYLMPNYLKVPNEPLAIWPWKKKHYKASPNDRIRELKIAGALIAAEIDRLQRLNS